MKRYLEIENVDDLPERGLMHVTTKNQDNKIIHLFKGNLNFTLRQAQVKLQRKGI